MKSNLIKLIGYYKPYRKLFLEDMFFAALSALCALIYPLVVRFVTSTLVYQKREEILSCVIWIALFLLCLIAIDCYSRYFIGYYGHVMGTRMEYDMRQEIFEHLQKLSFGFYDDARVGQLMSRITQDLFDITELLHHGPENIILSILKITGAFVILLHINPYLTLAAFIVLPFMFVFAFVLNKRMRRASRRSRARIAEINEQVEDSLSGIRVVKSFTGEEIENQNFRRGNDAYFLAKKDNYRHMGTFQAGVGTFTTMIQVCVIVAGCVLIAYGMLDIPDLVTFLLYISVFTDPVKTLVDFTEQFQNGYTGFERFREIMDIEPDIQDQPGARELENVRGDIVFEDVSFHYREGGAEVLSHISLTVPSGAYMALVGSSGVGKSTLCSLIPRFYDVSGGRILIDGQDIRELTLKSLRSHIGMVQQDVYLFAGTVYENILYGRPHASKEEVIEAAKSANAHEFILALPNGYDTDIGQRGIKLSGGQKQRLSIARVFLKNPEILIFDEATSSLDTESEKVVQESLEKLSRNRTTFVIAHRLSTIRNAEKILVLTEHGIAESGTHEELIKKDGIYARFYHTR